MIKHVDNIKEDLLIILNQASKIAQERYKKHLIKDLPYIRKADHSIVCEADIEVEKFLLSEIKKITPTIPIISEEDFLKNNIDTSNIDSFWLLDPIDGTKHFWHKKGEFSINIALIYQKKPIFGLINIPLEKTSYFAIKDQGCFKTKDENTPQRIAPQTPKKIESLLTGEITNKEKLAKFKALFPNSNHIMCGSAIKFCRIAEGNAQLYPKLASIMEWDTAAGQIILEETGGGIFDLQKNSLTYNKPHYLNPPFFAIQHKKLIEQLDFLEEITPN